MGEVLTPAWFLFLDGFLFIITSFPSKLYALIGGSWGSFDVEGCSCGDHGGDSLILSPSLVISVELD